MDQTELKN